MPVGRRCRVVEAKDQAGVVRRRTIGDVLELPVAVQVPNHDVELPVWSEENYPTVVIGNRRGKAHEELRTNEARAIPGCSVESIAEGRRPAVSPPVELSYR